MLQSLFSKACGLIQLCYILSYISLRSLMVEDAYTKLQPRRFNWNVSHESISRVWLSFDTKVL